MRIRYRPKALLILLPLPMQFFFLFISAIWDKILGPCPKTIKVLFYFFFLRDCFYNLNTLSFNYKGATLLLLPRFALKRITKNQQKEPACLLVGTSHPMNGMLIALKSPHLLCHISFVGH